MPTKCIALVNRTCPTGFEHCLRCHLWFNLRCNYGAFKDGALCQPVDLGPGITIEKMGE